MVAARDARLGVSSEDKRKRRADIAAPPIDAGADAWQKGKVIQINDPTGAHAHVGKDAADAPSDSGKNATSKGSAGR